jgi:hypothetical protein
MLIETTMNLHSKLKQGWLPVIQNEKQLFTTTRNTKQHRTDKVLGASQPRALVAISYGHKQ